MAKRKRLSPARPDLVDSPAPQEAGRAAPETKAAFPTYRDGFTGDADGWLSRRAPIASVAGEASASAALAEMAETLTEARESGRMLLELPLEQVQPDHLVRDRVVSDEEEMQSLMQSLAARGQQTPIEVVDLGQDQGEARYGLISGWRRLEALKRLRAEEGEGFGTVLALLRRPGDAAEAYLSMVEENEIRVGLSYYERARIAARAVEQGVYPTETEALRGLFHAASRPKRSKIGSFLPIVAALDGVLRFPAALGERTGLALCKALDEDPELGPRLRARLAESPAESAEAEQRMIAGALAPTPAKSTRTPAIEPESPPESTPRPGLRLKRNANGSLTLSGPALDADLEQRLRAWLAEQA